MSIIKFYLVRHFDLIIQLVRLLNTLYIFKGWGENVCT